MMKEFFWQYFSKCGSLDAYLLYKEENEDSAELAGMEELSRRELLAEPDGDFLM